MADEIIDSLKNYQPPPLDPQTKMNIEKILDRVKAQYPMDDGQIRK